VPKHQADSAALETQISSLQDNIVVWKYHANRVSCHAHGVMEQYSSWVKGEVAKLALLASDAERLANQDKASCHGRLSTEASYCKGFNHEKEKRERS
jgi:hypothetical protein